MYINYALWFALFGIFTLLFFLISLGRAKQLDRESRVDSKLALEVQRARRAMMIGTATISVSSFVVAALLYTHTIDPSSIGFFRHFHLIVASGACIFGVVGYIYIIWRIYQFQKKVEIGATTDVALTEHLNKAKALLWKWPLIWGVMIIIILLI